MDMSALLLAPIFAGSAYGVARTVAYPIAWLKLRRTEVWRERPENASTLALLIDFVGPLMIFCVVFGFLLGLSVWLGTAFA